jgi:hypothetical protein
MPLFSLDSGDDTTVEKQLKWVVKVYNFYGFVSYSGLTARKNRQALNSSGNPGEGRLQRALFLSKRYKQPVPRENHLPAQEVHMDRDQLRALQAPLKQRYREDPESALITPATGGTGLEACSGDMLLQALVACSSRG